MPKKPTPDQVKKVRSGVTKKIRFEVFKRDGFKCQYCGSSAPDVILHVDHVTPVSKGGDNDLMNLITSCESCNGGKSDRELNDNSVLEKQRQQLQELNLKREQLEMMISWRDGLKSLKDDVVDIVATKIEDCINPFTVNDNGKKAIKRWLRIYKLEEVLDAIEIAADRKLTQEITQELTGEFFDYIPRVAATKRKPPEEQRIYYIRGILKNRIYINQAHVMSYLKAWNSYGLDLDELTEFAKVVPNWTTFKLWVSDRLEEARQDIPF
ncbi:HNH endonuclease [Pantoea cypripedii]|uniref:HNH endonuclease n=1 Tax=Pantoea cypripedii TaxID=55209 RepID=A0A6B9FYK1_PANCY|nr:HNH endonuclease [Pantoea cypripedii]QGY29791.1 HNH endonuclease [Pantoea cypripedii]